MGVWWNVDTPELESGTSNGVRVRVSPSPLTLLFEQMFWLVWNQLILTFIWEYKKYFKFICIIKIFLLYLYCKFIYYIGNPRWVLPYNTLLKWMERKEA